MRSCNFNLAHVQFALIISTFIFRLIMPGVLNAQAASDTQSSIPAIAMTINLEEALEYARKNSPQLLSARIGSQLAHEDHQQLRASFLPNINYLNQYLYTQGNGTPSGVFIANDGVHVYNSQAVVHQELFFPGRRAEYQQANLAEAIAMARTEIVSRGLIATVVQAYYSQVVADRRVVSAQKALEDARFFFEITQKQQQGGEVARSDVVKAQLLLFQRERECREAKLSQDKARLALGVLLFADFRRDFKVVDDLPSTRSLPSFEEVQHLASRQNPDLRAAQLALQHEKVGINGARTAYLPSLSFDYFFGINSNQFATRSEGIQRLGSSAQVTLNIPVWNWGSTQSKVRQAQMHFQQAQADLSLTQRQLLANLHSFYLEAQLSQSQLDSLQQSVNSSQESLRLILLRYKAGESTVLEVVDAENTQVQARNALDDGWMRFRSALANLQTLTGAY